MVLLMAMRLQSGRGPDLALVAGRPERPRLGQRRRPIAGPAQRPRLGFAADQDAHVLGKRIFFSSRLGAKSAVIRRRCGIPGARPSLPFPPRPPSACLLLFGLANQRGSRTLKKRTGEPWQPASEYAASLSGLSLNLLVPDIAAALPFHIEAKK